MVYQVLRGKMCAHHIMVQPRMMQGASERLTGACPPQRDLAEYEVVAAENHGPGAVVRIVPGFDTRIVGDPIRHGDVMGLKYDEDDAFLHGFCPQPPPPPQYEEL